MGSAGGGPDFLMLKKVFIQVRLQGLGVSNRRDSPNCKSRFLADKIRVRFFNRFSNQSS